jgi:glycolate oxidase iron-sulfur subunit
MSAAPTVEQGRASSPSAPPERFLDYDKSLACIHCGLCLSSCPTYLETGNENDSPRGRIYLMRAVQDGRLPLDDTSVQHIDLCLGCRACEAVCPSGVHYGHLLEHTRDHLERTHKRSAFQTFLRRFVIEKIFPHRERMELALFPARIAKSLNVEKFLPKFAKDALSLIPDNAKADPLPPFSPATGTRKGKVGFIRGCVMDVMFSQTNQNTVRLLNAVGYDVVIPEQQGCCGALFAHSGNLSRARDCARDNILAFGNDLDAIVINAAGCGSTLKEYGELLRGDENWEQRGKNFSAKVKDITEFLATNPSPVTSPSSLKVTYHDACHLAHPQKITKQPRDLIKAVAGKNFVELPESDVCCGSAGTYNLTEPEMAERLQNRKTQNIIKTGTDIVVTTNPGCLLQIRAGLEKAGSKIKAMHIADYLALPNDDEKRL